MDCVSRRGRVSAGNMHGNGALSRGGMGVEEGGDAETT